MKFLLFFLILFSHINLARAATPQNTPGSTPIRPIPEEEQQSALTKPEPEADQAEGKTHQTPKPSSQTLAQPAYTETAEDTSQPATGRTPPESGTDVNNIKKKNKNKYKKEKKEDRKKKYKDRKKKKQEKTERKNQQKKK